MYSNELYGKYGGTFVSSNSRHGGQETTQLTTVTIFAHFGIVWVQLGKIIRIKIYLIINTQGYPTDLLFSDDEVLGGSPYGASCVAGLFLGGTVFVTAYYLPIYFQAVRAAV